MKKSEIGIFCSIIIGFTLKLLHLPASGILLTLLLSILSIFYLAGSWYLFRQDKQNLVISIIVGLLFSLAMVGILFKLQIWPGANEILTITNIGIIIMILVSGTIYALTKDAEIKPFYKTMLTRLVIITLFTGTLYFLPTRNLIKIYHSDDPEYVRLFIQAEENHDNKEYQKSLEEYRQKQHESTNNNKQ